MHTEKIPIYITESNILPQVCEHSEKCFIIIKNSEVLKSCFIYINFPLHEIQKTFQVQ